MDCLANDNWPGDQVIRDPLTYNVFKISWLCTRLQVRDQFMALPEADFSVAFAECSWQDLALMAQEVRFDQMTGQSLWIALTNSSVNLTINCSGSAVKHGTISFFEIFVELLH